MEHWWVTSASAAAQNTFSTTTSEGFFKVSVNNDQDQAGSQNTFSTIMPRASESIWTWLSLCFTKMWRIDAG